MTQDHPAFALSDHVVDLLAELRPAMATMCGIPGHDGRWDDVSPDGQGAFRERLVAAQTQISALPRAEDRWDALAVHVLEEVVGREIATIDRDPPTMWLNHLASPFQMFPLTLENMDPSTPEAVEDLVSRLDGLDVAMEQYRQHLEHQIGQGRTVSRRQVVSCIAQGRTMAEHRSFQHHADRAARAGHPEALVQHVRSAADRAQDVHARLTDWLESTYLAAAVPHDGVGEQAYLPEAESFLHVPIEVDDTLAWGWDEVERLHAELVRELDRAAPGRTLAEAVQMWRTDPSTSAPDADAFLDRIRAWQSDAMDRLGADLPMPEALRNLDIDASPPGSPPGAWYAGPSEDLSRPGRVRYSFVGDGPIPLFDQQSTAYHEGFPGHHLQIGIQRSLAGKLSRLHRAMHHCSGFAEGWALYAEQRMDEHGFYEAPPMRVGMLVNQIARACRVVLDLGLHVGRPIPKGACFEPGEAWTFERAVAFMTEIGGLRPEVSESEVLRYLGWPGQAISYKVGQRVLLDLRAEFLARGEHPVSEFHRRVLGSGTVGLGRVRAEVLG
ncbi:MAG: DUF885 domain-containing protein [Myxococcota bacterium]